MRKLLCFLLIVTISISLYRYSFAYTNDAPNASESIINESKIPSHASLDEDFAGDRVIVVLNNEASLEFNEFVPSDFSSIGCIGVKDYSKASAQKVRQQYETILAAKNSRTSESTSADVNSIVSFNQVLCIELGKNSKENVLAVIEELQKRDDVLYAGPDYAISVCADQTTIDTYANQQWALDSIQLTDAWDVTTGSSEVIVGVIDSGIDVTHPEFR